MMYEAVTGWYFLFFSSGWYTSPGYHVKVARSRTIMGTYEKWDTPVIETDWER